MAWSGNRPRREGGGIRGLALAWALAKKNLVPPSVSNKTQVSTATNPAAPTNNNRIKDGLVSEWWFDEGSGTTVEDRADLTVETDLTLSAGGGLWRQDAAKNNRWYMELSAGGALYNFNPTEINNTYINPTTAVSGLTLESWIKPLSPSGANPGPGRIISFSNASTGSQDVTFMLGHGTWNNAGYNAANYHSRVLVGNPSNSGELTELWTGDDTSTSTLQHLVMTCNLIGWATGNQQVETKLYLDGILKSTKIVDDPDGLFTSWNTAHTLKIGYETGNVREFKGGVYLVAMYSKALTQGEINNNFSEGVVSVTDAYSVGRTLNIEDVTASTVNAGETISVNIIADGSRSGPVNFTLGASSTSGTYGTDFVFDDTTKKITRAQENVTAELSCSPTLSGDINIVAYVATATGGSIVSSPGVNLSEKTFRGISDQVAPEVMFKSPNPVHVVTTQNGADQEVVSVGVNRLFHEPITVTVSGVGDSGNDAAYAWIKEDGTYADFPSKATYTVSADNWEKWPKIHSYSGTGGTVFPDGDVLSSTVVSGALSGGGALTVRAAASATTVTIDHPDFGMGVEPTSSNTGYRISTGALVPWVGTPNFIDEGVAGLNDTYTTVPTGGLTISGRKFTEKVKVYCNNPIKFVDCYFEGERRWENMSSYALQTYNTLTVAGVTTDFADTGKKLTVDYCTFWGGSGPTVTAVFESLNYCSFNWTLGDYIRFQSSPSEDHDFLVANCWFGPHVNIQDNLADNGNDGMYDQPPTGSTYPHADMGQVWRGKMNSITYRQCTFAAVADEWSDGTSNPTNIFGANPDKIWQISGHWGDTHPTKASSCNIVELDRNWIYGTGNSWCVMSEDRPGEWPSLEWRMYSNLIALEANGSVWNLSFPAGAVTRVTDGNNTFMRTGTTSLRIPQVAIDAGTHINHTDGMSGGQSSILSCERWIKGLDTYTAVRTGLNESGRTSFDTRSTPV